MSAPFPSMPDRSRVKPSTREIILAALRGDESVANSVVEQISGILDGSPDQRTEDPRLLTMTEAAKELGLGRTWFWQQVTADRHRVEKLFPPVEISPGQYRYRRRDIEAFARRTTTYAPVSHRRQKNKG